MIQHNAVCATVFCVLFAAFAVSEGALLRTTNAQPAPENQVNSVLLSTVSEVKDLASGPKRVGLDKLGEIESALLSISKQAPLPGQPLDHDRVVRYSTRNLLDSQLKPRVLADFKAISDQITQAVGLFQKCEDDRLYSLRASLEQQVAMPGFAGTHKACRMQEASLNAERQQCDIISLNAVSIKKGACDQGKLIDVPRIDCASDYNEDPEAYHLRMMRAFQRNYEVIRQNRKSCADATTNAAYRDGSCTRAVEAHRNKREECNAAQDKMDSHACMLAMSMNTTCMSYQLCRRQSTMSYNLADQTVAVEETNLHNEWKSLKHIECMLDALGTTQPGVAVQACNNVEHSIDHLRVVRVPVPECQPCELLAEIPGSPEYESLMYKQALPPGAQAKECTAMCCLTDKPIATQVQGLPGLTSQQIQAKKLVTSQGYKQPAEDVTYKIKVDAGKGQAAPVQPAATTTAGAASVEPAVAATTAQPAATPPAPSAAPPASTTTPEPWQQAVEAAITTPAPAAAPLQTAVPRAAAPAPAATHLTGGGLPTVSAFKEGNKDQESEESEERDRKDSRDDPVPTKEPLQMAESPAASPAGAPALDGPVNFLKSKEKEISDSDIFKAIADTADAVENAKKAGADKKDGKETESGSSAKEGAKEWDKISDAAKDAATNLAARPAD
eukprot:TRINITY_DN93443_c0_g1_i1.p1 TRINITY_DN93443_c0_g1~~TRINITY_DN93443_c0_g1_i1.p1  ORF type:complete len:671 (+),score=170.59 TRINITY_DN93443_c0_g1_i1:100-2112(+)